MTREGSTLVKFKRFQDESCTIQLKNMSPNNVNRLVATTLRLDASKTLPLACEIHRKTAGNCFFVIHFLKYLELKELFTFSLSSYHWTWDMDRIICETEAAGNVAKVVTVNLSDLPRESQSALAVAACFGNKFVGEVLGGVLERLTAKDSSISTASSSRDLKAFLVPVDTFDSPDVDESLTSAVEAGIIDKLQGVEGGDMVVYKFAHDKIQTAAYDLVVSKDRLGLHLLLGKMLWDMLADAAPDQYETLLVKIVE
jgi:predicted ATPase